MAEMTGTTSFWRRAALAGEAFFPVIAQQAYLWVAGAQRTRGLDVAVGVTVTLIVGWYVFRRREMWTPATLGLTGWRTHARALTWLLLITGGFVAALLLGGWLTTGQPGGGLRQNWDILRAAALYPLWGLVQQGLVLGVIYPRCRALLGDTQTNGARGRGWGAALLAAGLFGAAHAPNPLLMVGGALMVFFFALVWRRYPALLAVALGHGLIGAVCDKALHVSMRVGARYLLGE